MLVRLFVLGIVFEHDTHGYEIKATAKLWGIERWAKIGFGSIYHAISKLKEEGLIEEMEVERAGSRPPRYMFRITEAGRTVFLEMLKDTLRGPSYERRDIDLALAFAGNLPAAERQELIRDRVKELREDRARVQELAGYATHDLAHVPWVGISLDHNLMRLDAEIAWTEKLVEQIATLQPRRWSN